jgi:polygalacturonase
MTGLVLGLLLGRTTLNIANFGAVGDGKTLSTKAIQSAIDEAGKKGGTVVFPAGKFLTGTIHLRSHVNLHLDDGAILLGSARRKDYEKIIWYCLISANKVDDVKITGHGTIDGQGGELAKDVLRMVDTGEIKIPPKGWRPSELDRPEIIEMNYCKGVDITGVTIKNSCCWVQTYRECEDLFMNDVKIDSKSYWNNDGIDILDCKRVKIFFCDIDACDDGICLKSDNPKSRCEDVAIASCKIRSSASALKFGTSSRGGFKDVTIRDCVVRDTFRSVIALESVDGGTLENIDVGNIKATNTGNAFFIRLGHRTLTAPVGRVKHIWLHDFDVQVPLKQPDLGYPFKGPDIAKPHNVMPSSIVGHKEFPIEDIKLERIKIRYPGAGSASIANVSVSNLAKIPEYAENYPEFNMFGELPAWALFIRHAKGISIKDCSFTLAASDYRPAIVADDVSNFTGSKVKILGADKSPTLVVRNGRGIKVHGLKKVMVP